MAVVLRSIARIDSELVLCSMTSQRDDAGKVKLQLLEGGDGALEPRGGGALLGVQPEDAVAARWTSGAGGGRLSGVCVSTVRNAGCRPASWTGAHRWRR